MNRFTRNTSLLIATVILFASCTSTTLIQSNPSKAKLFIDGAYIGETPYYHSDSKIVGSLMLIKIEKDGYKPLISTITKDEEVNVGAVIGGFLCTIPFLWTMKYQAEHNYELVPLDTTVNNSKIADKQAIKETFKSKADELRDLKKLLDDKIITQDEFEKEKAKVLDRSE